MRIKELVRADPVVRCAGGLHYALARRDVLRARHSVVTAAADAAVGRSQAGMGRQLRSELKMLAALPVATRETDDLHSRRGV